MPAVEDILSAHGFRRTPGRVALLQLLYAQSRPVRAKHLQEELTGSMDTVTLYRALESLTAAGILTRYDFGHGHAHYELAYGRPEHSHAVCDTCGRIEDVPLPHTRPVLHHPEGFAHITRQSLELYGQCVECAS